MFTWTYSHKMWTKLHNDRKRECVSNVFVSFAWRSVSHLYLWRSFVAIWKADNRISATHNSLELVYSFTHTSGWIRLRCTNIYSDGNEYIRVIEYILEYFVLKRYVSFEYWMLFMSWTSIQIFSSSRHLYREW